ncbi:MAG: DUF1700 domain-containing protein [Lachnospiraceae bacterium]
MTRTEFLEELQQALQGEVSPAVITDNLRYYENYIMEEARKGRTEEEVLEELGNPRLLARTIIDTSSNFRAQESYENTYENTQDEGVHVNFNGNNYYKKRRSVKIAAWVGVAIILMIVIVLILLVGSVISFLAPVIIPIILVLVVIGVLSGRR